MPKPTDLVKLKRDLSKLAEQVAREEFGLELDYSVGSVRQVEEMLGQFHTHYIATQSEDGLRGLALEFAAYLLCVIERHFGAGTWRRDHPDFGPDSFPYEWKGGEIFPYGWCLKRIIDGPQDDVWSKFQVLIVAKNAEGAA